MIVAEVETESAVHGYEFNDGEDLEGIELYATHTHEKWQRISIYRVRELRDVATGVVRKTSPTLLLERVA